jgi:sugar/nucleoside kinase (ribokinase family)
MTPADLLNSAAPPERRFSLTVLGDVRLEMRARLPDRSFTEVTGDHLVYAPTRFLLSGTAVNMARYARRYFERTEVLAKVGDDGLTRFVQEELKELGIGARLHIQRGRPNGLCVMLRDSGGARRDGARLLIASDEAPSQALTAQDVRDSADLIEESDILFCDGYSLLSPLSRHAVTEALTLARNAGVRTAFDLVPHDIGARLGPDLVWPTISMADVIVGYAGTVAELVGEPFPAPGDGVPSGLLAALDAAATPRRPLWLLRHGEGGMAHVLAYRRNEVAITYDTGYAAATDKAGLGDRVTSAELYWWLSGGFGGFG